MPPIRFSAVAPPPLTAMPLLPMAAETAAAIEEAWIVSSSVALTDTAPPAVVRLVSPVT